MPSKRRRVCAARRDLQRAFERAGEVGVERAHLGRRAEVQRLLRQPILGQVLEQRIVLDRYAQPVVALARGVRRVDVGHGQDPGLDRARGLEEVDGARGARGRRHLGRLERRFLRARVEGAFVEPDALRRRARCVARQIGSRARARALHAQRGGRDRGEELRALDAPAEREQEPRMIHEQDQALLVARDAADEVEVLGPLELRARAAGIVAELPRADELAQVAVALRALDESDHAAGQAARVGDLGADDRLERHALDRGERRALRRAGRLQVLDQARERVDFGQREAGQPELARARDELRRRIDAGHEGVVAVDAEGDVHGGGPPPRCANPNGSRTIWPGRQHLAAGAADKSS